MSTRGVRAGHDAITEIDKALRLLHQERQRLVSELVADERALLDQLDAFDTHKPNVEPPREPAACAGRSRGRHPALPAGSPSV